jgi:hypothetical protein
VAAAWVATAGAGAQTSRDPPPRVGRGGAGSRRDPGSGLQRDKSHCRSRRTYTCPSPKAAPPAWVRRLGRGRGPADDSARTPAAHERGGRPAQPSQIDQVYVPPPPRSSGASPPCGAKPGHRLGDDQREYRSVRRPHGDFVAQDCDYEVNSGRDGKCGKRPGPRTRAAGWYSPRTQATSPPYPVRCRDDGFLSGEPTARTHLRRA